MFPLWKVWSGEGMNTQFKMIVGRGGLKSYRFGAITGGLVIFLAAAIVGNSQTPANNAVSSSAASVHESAVVGQVSNKETRRLLQQKSLAGDTAELLVLANELKIEMDKSSKDMLSLTVVRKAAQVEKQAHKVRDEMQKSLGY